VEVTLLGRGNGESCVVHYGLGRWFIVDSFFEPDSTQTPAAQIYLESLGVSPEQIDAIVVSHVHADHYLGVMELHDNYRRAILMLPDAIRLGNYLKLIADPDSGVLGGLPYAYASAKERRIDGVTGLRWLSSTKNVVVAGDVDAEALAPVDAARLASDMGLEEVINSLNAELVSDYLKDENRASVVIRVATSHYSALLTGDMVATPADFGWPAIIAHPKYRSAEMRSDLVKAPHHGSQGSDCDELWGHLVSPDPHVLVAPYRSSGIPDSADIDRLAGISSGKLWQAAPSSLAASNEPGPDGVVIEAEIFPKTGRITARRRPGEARWRVHVSGAAFRVTV
jgi:hypothetical protein